MARPKLKKRSRTGRIGPKTGRDPHSWLTQSTSAPIRLAAVNFLLPPKKNGSRQTLAVPPKSGREPVALPPPTHRLDSIGIGDPLHFFSLVTKVYIWDMDETLILLKSLLDGSYAGPFDGLKDHDKSIEIGKRSENLILELCDEHFFYEEIENYNEPFLNALSEYDDGKDLTSYDFEADCFSSPYDDVNKRKLAYRHRAIGEKYAKGLEKILDQHMVKVWKDLYSLTDKYTDGWLSSAHKLLEEALGKSATPTANSSSINCIVTSGSLIPSLAKCLLYRLDDVVLSENVYSSWEVGKLQCFKWIKERFDGPNVRFCAIGDGHEECSAAQIMKWPFIKIEFRPDGTHRFPGLDMPTIQNYMDVIYESSGKDG